MNSRMQSDCVSSRASALVEAASTERYSGLIKLLQQSRADMATRGMSASSGHALEMIETCAAELRERAKVVWHAIQRAHESCGSKTSEDLLALFRSLLDAEKVKLEQTQEIMVGPIVKRLQNLSMLQLDLLAQTREQLLVQYQAEIAMYIDRLKRGPGATFFEQLKGLLLNNKLFAAGATVIVVIVALASFTDALGKLSTFFATVVPNGEKANPAVQGTLRDKAAQRP